MTKPQVTDAMIEAALDAVQDLHIARTGEQKWEPANEVPDPSFRDVVATAIEAALAHQDGEVVGWAYEYSLVNENGDTEWLSAASIRKPERLTNLRNVRPLYAHPPAMEDAQNG